MAQIIVCLLTATNENYGVLFTLIPAPSWVALAWRIWLEPGRSVTTLASARENDFSEERLMTKASDVSRRTAIGAVIAGVAAMAAGGGRNAVGQEAGDKERVQGIGGFFFRAKDPKTLAEWYERHLGITRVPENYDLLPWRTNAGTTVFAPFREDTSYFGDQRLQWMINFRVRDLQKMTDQLRAEGIEVELDPEVYPNGRFARLSDPEGNPIQLWQPGGKDPG